ncbi:UNVERIFIED_ORG: hypothetical protein ABID57_001329 [Arthrobacter sp. UYEF1]
MAHTPESLAKKLTRQIRLLTSAAELFDQGNIEQCLTMATSVRVLLHDHKQEGKPATSVSLLKQTGFKDKLRFVDTSLANTTVNTHGPVVSMEVELEDGSTKFVSMGQDGLVDIHNGGPTAFYVASCRQIPDRKFRLPFGVWWEDPIMDLPNRGRYSRWDLIRAICNHDGGAHVDPRGLEEGYSRFVEEGFQVWYSNDANDAGKLNPEGLYNPTGDAAATSMRQLTFEVLETMRECDELQRWLKSPR